MQRASPLLSRRHIFRPTGFEALGLQVTYRSNAWKISSTQQIKCAIIITCYEITRSINLKELMKLVLDKKEVEELLLLAINELYDLPAVSVDVGYGNLPEVSFELRAPDMDTADFFSSTEVA